MNLENFLLTPSLEVSFEASAFFFLISHDVYLKSVHALIYFVSYEEFEE